MSDRIDSLGWPSPRGPWPDVTDLSRLYDHGQPWCVNADGHPDAEHGYPDPGRHLPWHECRSIELNVDGALRELDGEQLGMSAYIAAPFRFGQTRDALAPSSPRIVLESWPVDADEPAQRISLTQGEALRLARTIVRLIDGVIPPTPFP